MIISRTPFRISLFGGGTDFPEWISTNGSRVISASIDKYCYISARKLPGFFSHSYRLTYSEVELAVQLEDIKFSPVREAIRLYGPNSGLEINHQGDLPARSGLGSSSAFSVGLINALSNLNGLSLNKRKLATCAINFERDILKENVGLQDQIAVAHGGFNLITFKMTGGYEIIPINIEDTRLKILESRLLLFYTGIQRFSSEIISDQMSNLQDNRDSLSMIALITDKALQVLLDQTSELDQVGHLLHESWIAKRSLSAKISSNFIDTVYSSLIESGALGGKILGAGGGGFLLMYCPEQFKVNVLAVAASLGLLWVPFEFESHGSKIIYKDI